MSLVTLGSPGLVNIINSNIKMESTSSAVAPPAYEPSPTFSEHALAIVNTWAIRSRDESLCGCGSRCQKNSCTKFATLCFGFQAEISSSQRLRHILHSGWEKPAWRAVLLINARNIAELMLAGLSWSQENVMPGYDDIYLDVNDRAKHRCALKFPKMPEINRTTRYPWISHNLTGRWPHARTYQLQSVRAQTPVWEGLLVIYADKPATVINFELKSITTDSTAWVLAKDGEERVVFDNRGGPERTFNSVFSGMVDGWWTCPGSSGSMVSVH